MPRTEIVVDDFSTYVAGNLAAQSADWEVFTAASGELTIVSGELAGGGSSSTPNNVTGVRRVTETFSDDQYGQVTVGGVGDMLNFRYAGVALRSSGTTGSRTFYYAYLLRESNQANVLIWRVVANVGTQLLEVENVFGGRRPQAADTMALEVEGTTLRAFANGVQVGPDVIDANIASGIPGVVAGGGTADSFISLWSAGDVGEPSTDITVLSNTQATGGTISPAATLEQSINVIVEDSVGPVATIAPDAIIVGESPNASITVESNTQASGGTISPAAQIDGEQITGIAVQGNAQSTGGSISPAATIQGEQIAAIAVQSNTQSVGGSIAPDATLAGPAAVSIAVSGNTQATGGSIGPNAIIVELGGGEAVVASEASFQAPDDDRTIEWRAIDTNEFMEWPAPVGPGETQARYSDLTALLENGAQLTAATANFISSTVISDGVSPQNEDSATEAVTLSSLQFDTEGRLRLFVTGTADERAYQVRMTASADSGEVWERYVRLIGRDRGRL